MYRARPPPWGRPFGRRPAPDTAPPLGGRPSWCRPKHLGRTDVACMHGVRAGGGRAGADYMYMYCTCTCTLTCTYGGWAGRGTRREVKPDRRGFKTSALKSCPRGRLFNGPNACGAVPAEAQGPAERLACGFEFRPHCRPDSRPDRSSHC